MKKNRQREALRASEDTSRDDTTNHVGSPGSPPHETPRRESEEALQASEARYRALVEDATECVCRWLPDTTLTYVNKAYCHYFGKSQEELLGSLWMDLVPPEERDTVRRNCDDMNRTPRRIRYAHRVADRTQDVQWMEWTDAPILDDEGQVMEWQSIGRDITKSKQVEETLQHHLNMQAFMARVSLRYINLTSDDVDATIHETLREVGELTHVDRSYLFLIDEHAQTVSNTHEWCARGVRSESDNLQNIRLDRITWWIDQLTRFEIVHIPCVADMPDDRAYERGLLEAQDIRSVLVMPLAWRGALKGFLGFDAVRTERSWSKEDRQVLETLAHTMSQVIERRETEDRLRKLSRMVEQSPVSVILTDLEGRIEYVNPQFSRTTGYTLDEVRGRHPNLLKSGETPPEVYDELWRALSSGKHWKGEFRNRRKDGSLYWERSSVLPIHDGSGKPTHYLALQEDITSRKQMEEQLQQKQRVEAIGQLAGGIAHDFNNMLQVILGHAEMLQRKKTTDASARQRIEEILLAGRRSADLTNQLLAFAKRQTAHPTVINLNDVVTESLRLLERLIGEDIKVDWKAATDLWAIALDPTHANQIIANLALNARDAMDGAGTLTLRTSNVALNQEECRAHEGIEPGDYVLLSIKDSGSGMTDEVAGRIFEPFFTTKELGHGTGLGLSIVYGIVGQNGGFIDVQTGPDKGSIFNIYLPRARQARRDEAAAPKEETQGDETILFVEDEAPILHIGSQMLEQCGYRVLTAEHPEKALRLAESSEHDIRLLITDVVMPGMSGQELSRHLTSRLPNLKTLFVSGYTDDIIAKRGLLDDGIDFLHKPFNTATLIAKVREILDR